METPTTSIPSTTTTATTIAARPRAAATSATSTARIRRQEQISWAAPVEIPGDRTSEAIGRDIWCAAMTLFAMRAATATLAALLTWCAHADCLTAGKAERVSAT